MNTKTRFVKSFSKGQITIPKEFRKALGWEDEFWLKLSVEEGKLVAEPVETQPDKTAYRQQLLKLKPVPVSMKEVMRNRRQLDRHIKARAL